MQRVEPTDEDLSGHKPEETRVFEVPLAKELLGELRQNLFGDLEASLGSDRFQLFRSALGGWIPVDDADGTITGGAAVHNFSYRMRFYQPKPGDSTCYYSLNASAPRQAAMGGSISLDEIPDMFRAQLQDWIALSQSQPPKDVNTQK